MEKEACHLGGWTEELPQLKIELLADSSLLLTCTDPHGNGDDMIQVHPIQLRFMAEKLGLVEQLSASEADHLRTINKLARRLRLLHERIDHLDNYLINCSDHAHADLNYEMVFSAATLDLATEFLAELDESGTVETPRGVLHPRGDHTGPDVVSPESSAKPPAKACANPSGKASAKTSVKGGAAGTGSLFGGDHG